MSDFDSLNNDDSNLNYTSDLNNNNENTPPKVANPKKRKNRSPNFTKRDFESCFFLLKIFFFLILIFK